MTPVLRSSCCDLSGCGDTGQSLGPLQCHLHQRRLRCEVGVRTTVGHGSSSSSSSTVSSGGCAACVDPNPSDMHLIWRRNLLDTTYSVPMETKRRSMGHSHEMQHAGLPVMNQMVSQHVGSHRPPVASAPSGRCSRYLGCAHPSLKLFFGPRRTPRLVVW